MPFPFSLSDEEGKIIGSSIPEREGTMHTPSKEVIREGKVILYFEDKVKDMDNVLPGAAAPLQFDDKTIGVVGLIGPPEEVKPYVYLVKQYIEMMWQETVYRQLESLKNKNLESFAQYILLNESISEHRVKQFCEMLDFSYVAKRLCIVIDIGDALMRIDNFSIPFHLEDLNEKLIELTLKSYKCDEQSFCTFLNTEKIVVLKTVKNEADYEEALKKFHEHSLKLQQYFQIYDITDIRIAVGNSCTNLQGMHKSYLEAERLIGYGKKLHITPTIYSYHNWKLLITLLPVQVNDSFYEKVRGNLKAFTNDEKFQELAKTFIVYCETSMNISKAAKTLYLHRNTLIYRLQKIEAITNLDTKNFDDCTLLYLWLRKNCKGLQ